MIKHEASGRFGGVLAALGFVRKSVPNCEEKQKVIMFRNGRHCDTHPVRSNVPPIAFFRDVGLFLSFFCVFQTRF